MTAITALLPAPLRAIPRWFQTAGPRARASAFLLVFALFFALALLLPPISQSQGYHSFADARAAFGIPRFGDVASNLGFLLAAIAGILISLRAKRRDLMSASELACALTLFLGVGLTAFGSAYYHWAPQDARLIWDRLPMTLAFAGLLGGLGALRVGPKTGAAALALGLCAGAWSIHVWSATGNLTPYALMQFGGLLWLLIAFLFGHPRQRDWAWGSLMLAYGAAKLFELLDAQIFAWSMHLVSGHTLKHLAAAYGAWLIAARIRDRG